MDSNTSQKKRKQTEIPEETPCVLIPHPSSNTLSPLSTTSYAALCMRSPALSLVSDAVPLSTGTPVFGGASTSTATAELRPAHHPNTTPSSSFSRALAPPNATSHTTSSTFPRASAPSKATHTTSLATPSPLGFVYPLTQVAEEASFAFARSPQEEKKQVSGPLASTPFSRTTQEPPVNFANTATMNVSGNLTSMPASSIITSPTSPSSAQKILLSLLIQ